jgi:predicted ATPase
VELDEYSESSYRKIRGPRYQRIASLFEDHIALRPLQAWFQIRHRRSKEVIRILNKVLPENVRFKGRFDRREGQLLFSFQGREMPFAALSDGYKAFIGWVGDLLGHLCDVAPSPMPLDRVPGIVLVDEIDLHIHPEWQRTIVPAVARAFPALQFVFTSHSPIITGTLHQENIFVTERDRDGFSTVRQIKERVYGRSAEQLLLSPYFGLKTTRAEGFERGADGLVGRAVGGDVKAALDYLQELSGLAATKKKRANSTRRKPAKKSVRRRKS